MYFKKVLAFLSCMIFIVSMLLGNACLGQAETAPAEVEALKIGCIMPFTGAASMYGEETRKDMDIYVSLLNESGGVRIGNGIYKIEMYYADDGMQVAPSAAAARKLIYNEGVSAIVGYFGTGYAAVAPLTNPDKIIFIARSGADVYIDPQRDKYVIVGLPLGQYTLNQAIVAMEAYPEAKTICWTGPEGAKESIGSSAGPVDRWLEAKKGVKNLRIMYPPGTTNFVPYLIKMREQGAQIIYNGGTLLDIALMAKQCHELGFKVPLSSGSDNDIPILEKIAGADAIQGIIGNQTVPWELKKTVVAPRYLEIAEKIRDRFQETYGKPMPHYGSFVVGLNQTAQYLEACQHAGSIDPDEVMDAFKSNIIDTFIGSYKLTGTRTFGMPIAFGYPCAMAEIRGEESVYLDEYPLTDVDFWFDELSKYE
ncbi:MAG: ABC transporter substrate-binding protein [Dehalococcoidia bacterium]|nr:ABC transporter substrate-binding protein [Dehalococcoidia bacterium]